MTLQRIVEALLFASDAPLSAADIARAETDVSEADVREAIDSLRAEYDEAERAFGVYELAGGFQILTRPEFVPYLERFATVSRPARVSSAALEALAIVAYRQPIGRAEIEEIRGVGSAGVLRTLVERDLVEIVGRGEGLGRPLLYGTTDRFLEHFGYGSLEDLPRPEELPVVLRQEFAVDPTPESDPPPDETPSDAPSYEAPDEERLQMVVDAEIDRVVSAATRRPDPVG